MKKLLTKIFGDPSQKAVKKLNKKVVAINDLADSYKKMSQAQLRKKAAEYKKILSKDPSKVEELLPDVFALTREVSTRELGMRHFDVQLIGGMALHEGNIAEMRTGEGKTLVATLPVVLNGLTGRGVHVVTVNDYLARRDAGWMAQIYDSVGLSVGVIVARESYIYDKDFVDESHDDERLQHLRPCTRQEAYQADVTYGTNNEFGFDYLRDNMVQSKDQLRQRELAFAIVDEVDSILIDEARTPLIISAPASASNDMYQKFSSAVRKLGPEDYEVDEKQRSATMTDEGVEKMQKILGIENLYDTSNVQTLYHLDQALRAETLFKRDKQYVVQDGEVIIVDEFTGRLMFGRRYNEGLHQAIEAKEGVKVLQESMTLATISFQNYFRLYDKLSGMTGTAITEAEEFHTIYKLDVVTIPTNKPVRREDLPDKIFKTEEGKFKAIASDVKELQKKGQPVLIGTVSVEKNEQLSQLLTAAGVKHEVLNAKNNEGEAAIVAQAGQQGAVTLATNIAGRGTDIVLGEGVKELGGLYVVGTERHESRRIDNQLRGRCGRQGDPGTTQFYVSTEDDLMRIFGGERIAGLMGRLSLDETVPIQNKTITKALETAQKKVENHNFDSRKNVVQYDDVMNRHRKATYVQRRQILESEDISSTILEMIEGEIKNVLGGLEVLDEEKKTERIKELAAVIPLSGSERKKLLSSKTPEADAMKFAEHQLVHRERDFTPETMRVIEREVFMQVLDNLWMQHLENMQHLREGIGLRSIGQRDPLVEYRREGQIIYEQMQSELRADIAKTIFRVAPRPVERIEELETELTKAAEQASESTTGDERKESKTQAKRRKRRTATTDNRATKRTTGGRKSKKKQRKNRKKGRR